MGVITLALIASGHWHTTDAIPTLVKVACALAIASGTYIGGWRIIRTLGKGLVDISPAGHGRRHLVRSGDPGLQPLRIRAVHDPRRHWLDPRVRDRASGRPGALGSGRQHGGGLADDLPAAAVVGAVTWFVADTLGGDVGGLVIFLIMLAIAALMFARAQQRPIGSHNINEEWGATPQPTGAGPRPWTCSGWCCDHSLRCCWWARCWAPDCPPCSRWACGCSPPARGRRSYRIAAYAIFALVVMVVLLGIALIVANGLGVTLGE